jgi:hypothetical protein
LERGAGETGITPGSSFSSPGSAEILKSLTIGAGPLAGTDSIAVGLSLNGAVRGASADFSPAGIGLLAVDEEGSPRMSSSLMDDGVIPGASGCFASKIAFTVM